VRLWTDGCSLFRVIASLLLFTMVFSAGSAQGQENKSPAKRGGGLYFSWGFPVPKADPGYDSIEIDLNNINDPSTDQGLFFSTQLFCGTARERNTFYFGVQTNVQGRGKGVIMSRWGSRRLADTKVAPGCSERDAWSVSSDSEGGFIGVRRLVPWGEGRMSLAVARQQDDSQGRWFGITLLPRGSAPIFCGALRFPRDREGRYPQILAEGAGSFVEHYTEVSSEADVPFWKFLIENVCVDRRTLRAGPVNYRYAPHHEVWNNSNVSFTRGGWPLIVEMGGATKRRNPPSSF
jgi:hypothetical protein